MPNRPENSLIGQKFGKWTVVGHAGVARDRHIQWICLCDCGRKKIVSSTSLRFGSSRSCGCLIVESARKRLMKHGHHPYGKQSGTYSTWCHMIQRCTNVRDVGYENYLGRGIRIEDPRWFDFRNFLHDMGEKPPGLTIDRINNNKGYCKENCRWADRKTQNNNKRTPYAKKRRSLIGINPKI